MKSCRHCGVTPPVEGKGATWRGTGGWSKPNYFKVTHHCLPDENKVTRAYAEITGRTEEEAIELWNKFLGG